MHIRGVNIYLQHSPFLLSPFLKNNEKAIDACHFMNNTHLKTQIDEIKMLIEREEDNYKTAIERQTQYAILREMKDNIRKLKNDLQVLLEQTA